MNPKTVEITDIDSELYEWPKPPIWNGKHVYDKGALHLLRLKAKCGADEIIGYGFNGGTAATRSQKLFPGFVDEFRPHVMGKDPRDTTFVSKLAENIKMYGPGGYHTQVLAAINQACWDIRGKIEGKSIHEMLGGKKQKVRAYIAGGYYGRNKGMDELQEEMDQNVNESHATAVKMKIGDKEAGLKEDIRRIEAVRKQIGKHITLMVDANCALTVKQAKAYLPALKENNVFWFEEPVECHDYKGHQQIRETAQQQGILIATGENGYHVPHFETMMDYEGADVLNIDVAIMAGYDPAMQVIRKARKRNVLIAPHGAQDLHVHLADWILMLEYYPKAVDPLRAELFLPHMELDKKGFITVPTRPGLGFEPNMQLLKKHRIR